MKIGPLFKQFGSKWSGAKHYPTPLKGLPIFEPYAGGAGYSLNHAEFPVLLWDEDKNIRLLWSYLIYLATSGQIKEIPLNVPEGTDIRSLHLNLGQSLLLKHWQRTNNCGDCWTISAWGSKPGQWTANTRARIADEVGAVKHWQFRPVSWNDPGTYFIDPPYEFNYRYRFPKDSFDFPALGRQVRAAPKNSLVIACEAACPKTGAIPSYLPFYPWFERERGFQLR